MPAPNIVILTGAGISAESGIKTFRDANGLWENHRIEDVASPAGFHRDPDTVYRFYNMRRRQLVSEGVRENVAHVALAKLQKLHAGNVTIITQNIDDLHERGGAHDVLHMHGELLKARCNICNEVSVTRDDFNGETECLECHRAGGLRPHIVWFGEVPFYMDDIESRLQDCDIFVSIGTSGQVYPAAGFVALARQFGAETHELNLERSAVSYAFDYTDYGPATVVVPKWVDRILGAAD